MFGYVRPLVGELKVAEFERFKSAYCGLCHALEKRHGFFARFLLNYDLTFLAVVLEALEETTNNERRRCLANPFAKKCVVCRSAALDRAADATLILTWWKLDDEVRDSGVLKGLPARFLRAFFRGAYRKAARAMPSFSAAVEGSMEELRALEAENADSLDRVADTFARLLAAAADGIGEERARRAVQSLLYHVGRFVYIIDACDDYPDDMKSGAYNAVAARYRLSEPELPAARKAELSVTLEHSVAAADAAAELADFSAPWRPIILNVVRYGLPAISRDVFAGVWRARRAGKRIPDGQG